LIRIVTVEVSSEEQLRSMPKAKIITNNKADFLFFIINPRNCVFIVILDFERKLDTTILLNYKFKDLESRYIGIDIFIEED
jgi:hypothetical protein